MSMRHTRLLSVALLALVAAAPASPRSPAVAPSPSIRQKTESLRAAWKERFVAEQFNTVVAPPFLVAGDGSPAQVRRYADGTVVAAARALRATYFKTEAPEPVLILLFESPGSYKRLAKKWFGDDDVPHFGFYRRRENVMLMNIRTGTGTLVHEMVHALMAPDFPACPDWFNEGLASLYEQCSLDGDTIKGHVNWRLPPLRKAVQERTLRPLEDLIQDPNFYGDNRVGMNYAHARYLLMYLQEKGLLKDYYGRFRASAKDDPQGLKTLRELIAPESLARFEQEWRAWVLSLRAS